MLKLFFLFGKTKYLTKELDPGDLMCLSTEKNYHKGVLSDKSFYMVRSSLSRAIKKLPPEMFIKIHRSL